MSSPWSWFGGSSAQKRKESSRNAIISLRGQLELLQKREKRLQSQIDEQYAIARANANTNKTVAKKALGRKNVYQGYLDQNQKQMNTIEEQVLAIESANINHGTFEVMQQAASAMKQIHGKLTVEKLEETMDNLHEQNGLGDEITEAMNSLSMSNNQIDDVDLDAELEELQQEQVDEELLKLHDTPVPKEHIAGHKEVHSRNAKEEENDEHEEELRQLQAEMAM